MPTRIKINAHARLILCDYINHISVLGLPWGVLDVLEHMETVMDCDVHALLERLSQQEKYQINLALGAAMRAILALRPILQEVNRT